MTLSPPQDAPPPEHWHPKVRKLFEYWRSRHPAPDILPGRQHFDPLDIADLMPHIFMLELAGDPRRFRYRLVGTRIVEAMRRDLTRQWYDEAHPGVLDHPMHAYYLARTLGGQATWRRGRPWLHVDPDIYEIEQIVLPMARDGATVDLVLIITMFFRRDGQEAFR